MATVAFGSHGDIVTSCSGWRLFWDGRTPRRLPSPAKRNEFEPSETGRSDVRSHELKTSERPVNAAPAKSAAKKIARTTAAMSSARRRGGRRLRRSRERRSATSATRSESSPTTIASSPRGSVRKLRGELGQQAAENRDDDGEGEVDPADAGEHRPERLRPAFTDLTRQPGAENEVVQVAARHEETDEHALDRKRDVEPRRCRVEGVRALGNDCTGEDRDAEGRPADRAPTRPERAKRLRSRLALELLHRRHRDEDERDRPAGPHNRREEVHHAQSGVHRLVERDRLARPADRGGVETDARAARQRDGGG